MTWWRLGLLVVVVTGCRHEAAFQVRVDPGGSESLVTLIVPPSLRVNARVPPGLELPDGRVLRFRADRLSADSAYLLAPISAVVPFKTDTVHGTLRMSVCDTVAQVCRPWVIAL